MITEYTVGLRLGRRADAMTIEAEDALIAALRPIGAATAAIPITAWRARVPIDHAGQSKGLRAHRSVYRRPSGEVALRDRA